MSNPIVTFEMENGDIIKAELYPEVAPNTVNNFISLVSKGSTRLSARSLKASRLWTPVRTSAPIITTSPELRRS